ncbi:MAG: AAA family ATPase [Desulfosarcinaceae bacterium]|nr:AAA family ATPase [Desulfosarcinaceae bacterium]
MVRAGTRTIAVANEKGGVGKTATVINLGAALSKVGHRVLLVDMDPQANTTRGMGVSLAADHPSVYDLISGNGTPAASDTVVGTAWKRLDLLPSHVDLSGAEVELVDEVGRERKLSEALEPLLGTYDFILLDTPPSLSLLTVNVFTFAEEVLVPCQTHPYAFGALAELFDTIEAVQAEINPALKITGIIPTLFDGRTKVSREILQRLKTEERYRPLVFDTIIRLNTTVAESADVGKPVVFFRSGSYGAKDYVQLANELLGR